uniref:Proteasome assembly chaperone 2 n=1 Tax=Meteorus pulchricornis TaxID=51522 RepID=H7CHJ4_9HYME|nr:similar to proteasome assembly chaperone 2-like [Nasonia vitripennis] [Meteorus pulchricornis]
MIKLIENIDLSGCTLIIPAVAVGNVGQLAVDLLITSTKMKRIGHVISSCFIPILGADPYVKDSTELCTASDVYHSAEKKIVAIQIRSPSVKGLQKFFNDLKDFIHIEKISKVIILTSGWAHTRTDAQLRSEPLRYLTSPSIEKEYGKLFDELNWIKLESTKNPFDDSDCLEIPGGGFAMKLHHYLTINQIPPGVILKFCSEGDNVPDAVALTTYLDKWLPCGITDSGGKIVVKYPHSWEFLFGNPAPLEIY